jgi:hypothetical protein
MFIACTEKCTHQKDGLCTKNDCAPQNEFISGNISCPHYEPVITEAISEKPKSPVISEDHKRF